MKFKMAATAGLSLTLKFKMAATAGLSLTLWEKCFKMLLL